MEEEYLDSLSEEEKQQYLEERYSDLEAFEQWKDEQYERDMYEYISEGKTEKIPMHMVGVDAIGLYANVKDMDKFIHYLKEGVTRKRKIFSHKDNIYNFTNDLKSKYFTGIGFYGSVWMQFFEKPYRNEYSVSLVIYPKKLSTTPRLKEQIMSEFLDFFDKDNWRISRIDIDFTIFKDLSTYYLHKKGTQKFEIITRTKYASDGSIENVETYDNEAEFSEDIETRYIGNRRSSEFFIRLYNKKKQVEKKFKNNSKKKIPNAFPHISRLEIEIKKDGIKRWKDCLEKLTLKRPNYWDSNDLKPSEKVKIAGFLADNRLFSLMSQNTKNKYRKLINSLENSDDIIQKLEEELRLSHPYIVETVKEWTGQNIDY